MPEPTLSQAVALLRNEARHAAASDLATGRHPGAWAKTLMLAIDALEREAKVAPARTTDPETSHRAAPSGFQAGSARERILLGAAKTARPLSASELVRLAGLQDQRSPWKRVSELCAAGFLDSTGTAADPATGKEVTLYRATLKGRAKATEISQERGASHD